MLRDKGLRPSWDERYRSGDHLDDGPVPLLVDAVKNLSPGRALDLACGAGRHAIYLDRLGWQVTAVDASAVAIEILRQRAPSLDARIADLEKREFEIEPNTYDLICNCYYLQRELFPQIRNGVRPGGIALAIIHTVDEAPDVKPMNTEYLLHPGELKSFFPRWTILHDYEGKPADAAHRRVVAEIVARKPYMPTQSIR